MELRRIPIIRVQREKLVKGVSWQTKGLYTRNTRKTREVVFRVFFLVPIFIFLFLFLFFYFFFFLLFFILSLKKRNQEVKRTPGHSVKRKI
jgi:hypothetical protein